MVYQVTLFWVVKAAKGCQICCAVIHLNYKRTSPCLPPSCFGNFGSSISRVYNGPRGYKLTKIDALQPYRILIGQHIKKTI